MKILETILAASIIGLASTAAWAAYNSTTAGPKYEEGSISYNCESSLFKGTTCNVYLGGKLLHERNFTPIIQLLDNLKPGDTATVNVSGYGGYVSTGVAIVSAMKRSDATVITQVSGPVYSGHALLALAGDIVVVQDDAYFMFHHTSMLSYADYCGDDEGETDRGQSAHDKCEDSKAFHIQSVEDMYTRVIKPYLTEEQWLSVLDGYDVYVTSEEIKSKQ